MAFSALPNGSECWGLLSFHPGTASLPRHRRFRQRWPLPRVPTSMRRRRRQAQNPVRREIFTTRTAPSWCKRVEGNDIGLGKTIMLNELLPYFTTAAVGTAAGTVGRVAAAAAGNYVKETLEEVG